MTAGRDQQSAPGRRLRRILLPLLALPLLLLGLTALVLSAPSGVLSRLLDRTDADLRLLQPAGRLYSGSGQLVVDGTAAGRLHWRLQPGALLQARIQLRLQLDGPDHEFGGHARLTPTGLRVHDARGMIGNGGLQTLLQPYDIHPAGEIRLTDLAFRLDAGGQLQDAHGDLDWTGGWVSYQLGGQQWHADFPPLQARLRQPDAGDPELTVTDDQARELLDLHLDQAGWAHLRVRYRFIAMAGFPWPDGPPPDTVLIELSEQLWQR